MVLAPLLARSPVRGVSAVRVLRDDVGERGGVRGEGARAQGAWEINPFLCIVYYYSTTMNIRKDD